MVKLIGTKFWGKLEEKGLETAKPRRTMSQDEVGSKKKNGNHKFAKNLRH